MKGFRAKTPGEREEIYSPRAERAAWHRFYREALRRGKNWLGCMACPPERRDPKKPLEVHHVVSQRRLKRWCRERNIPKGSLEELAILTDSRNSMLLDERCHGLHPPNGTVPLPRQAIPPYAWEFIDEKGLREEIHNEYPRRGD